ncbi:MAG: carbohydrate ABC transporter permease [Spirochaetales bacterium]|jgi:multiple sugar transport system permease protein|nr:carbohydrate ABC transporter permease [Spirochaetales bacterium]
MRSGSSIIHRRSTGGWILLWVVLFAFSLWTIFPLFWAVVTSFKFTGDAYDPTFIPWVQFKPTLQGWRFVLITAGERTFRSLKNSIVIAFFSSAAVLFLGSMAGYALARFVFRKWKNKDIAVWILSNRMFPPVAVLIPYFLIMRTLRLLDNPLSIIIAHTILNLPLGVWLMIDFFRDLPRDLDDAALIDGCSFMGAFFRIALPLVAPGLVAVFVLSFIFSWNEFIFVLVLGFNKAITIPITIAGALTTKGLEFWKVATMSLIGVIPVVLLATFISRFLIRGLTMGAIKE